MDQDYQNSSPIPSSTELAPEKRTYLVWSILATLFCCVPFGIVAIVMSVKADSAYTAGNYDDYERCAKSAKKWILISVVIGVLAFIVGLVQGVVAANAVNNVQY